MKQRFYTPGLFARVLKGEKLPDVGSIQTIKLFPRLEVQAPPPGSTRLSVKLTNRGGGIGRVVVKVNGKELAFHAPGPRIDPNAPTEQFSIDLTGAVRSADGREFRRSHRLRREQSGFQPCSPRRLGHPHCRRRCQTAAAVRHSRRCLGVRQPRAQLKFPAKDAESMALALQLAGKGLFGQEQVSLHLLTTSGLPGSVPPTKNEFRNAFDSIGDKAEPQDVLVIYLAGHGVARRGIADQYYYLKRAARSTELPANDPNMLYLATISSEELTNWCKRIRAMKQVIILDTCAAGAANQQLLKLSASRELSPDQVRRHGVAQRQYRLPRRHGRCRRRQL